MSLSESDQMLQLTALRLSLRTRISHAIDDKFMTFNEFLGLSTGPLLVVAHISVNLLQQIELFYVELFENKNASTHILQLSWPCI